jgi:hypothetical protein
VNRILFVQSVFIDIFIITPVPVGRFSNAFFPLILSLSLTTTENFSPLAHHLTELKALEVEKKTFF